MSLACGKMEGEEKIGGVEAELRELGKELVRLLGYRENEEGSKPFWIMTGGSDEITGMVFPKKWVEKISAKELGTRSRFARFLISSAIKDDFAFGSYVLSLDRLRIIVSGFRKIEETFSAA